MGEPKNGKSIWKIVRPQGSIVSWFRSLDQILRGEATAPSRLDGAGIQVPLRGLCVVSVVMAMFYGICMGSFALFREFDPDIGSRSDRYMQICASMLKVPALFFLTLAITTPSLYVFNALVGSRLNLLPMLRLLVASLGVNLAVLASLGPIVAFFSVSTTSYDFMLIFNVVIFAVSGGLGLMFLIQTLNRLSRMTGVSLDFPHIPTTAIPSEGDSGATEGSTERVEETLLEAAATEVPSAIDAIEGHVLGQHVRVVFWCWLIVYGLVGAQMGWVLRPFLGDPELAFTWFRERDSNFFQNVLQTLVRLLGLGS